MRSKHRILWEIWVRIVRYKLRIARKKFFFFLELWHTILRTAREQVRIVSRQNYFLFLLNRLPYCHSLKWMFCCNIIQCHSYICKYLDMFWGHCLFYFVDVYFLCFVCLSVTKKIWETTTGKQSDSRSNDFLLNLCIDTEQKTSIS